MHKQTDARKLGVRGSDCGRAQHRSESLGKPVHPILRKPCSPDPKQSLNPNALTGLAAKFQYTSGLFNGGRKSLEPHQR